jgi:hypothetical protein
MSTQPEEQQNPPQNPPENPPNPPANPPQSQPNPQQNPPQQSQPNPEQTARTAQNAASQLLDARSLQELRTEIQALPERIVNGIREATQPPRSTPQGQGSGNSGTPTAGAGNAPGQRKSFADWWFNS